MVDANESLKQTGCHIDVLREYPYEVFQTEYQEGVWRLETNRGPKALYRYNGKTGKTLSIHNALEHLAGKGFRRTSRYIRTRDGRPYVNRSQSTFILTDWLPGRKADFKREEDIRLAAKNLADVHRLGSGAKHIGDKVAKPGHPHWVRRLLERSEEYRRYRQLVDRKDLRNTFDDLFMAHSKEFELKGNEALNKMVGAGIEQLADNAIKQGQICHRDWCEYNLLITSGNRLGVIGWEHCGIDMPVVDLARYIRRAMATRGIWDGSAGKKMLAAYEENRPLSKIEKDVLIGLLMFPRKFWLSAAGYYRGEGAQQQMLDGLKQAILEEAERKVFLNDVSKYLGQ